MEDNNKAKLSNGIIETLSGLPGIIGFVDKTSTSSNLKKLSESLQYKGIDLQETHKGWAIKVFIITSMEIRNNLIAKEIYQSIKFYFKKQDAKVLSINIFFKGVR